MVLNYTTKQKPLPASRDNQGSGEGWHRDALPPFDLFQDFFYAETEALRLSTLQNLLNVLPSALSDYLAGTYYFVRNDFERAKAHLESAIANSLDGYAEIRARVLLAAIIMSESSDKHSLKTQTLRLLESKAGGLLSEIEMILERSSISALQDHIARVLDFKIERPQTIRAFIGKVRRKLMKY